jgi:hypothetical protein
MKLPNLSPPVQRNLDPTHARQATASEARGVQISALEQSGRINAADYGECYNLRGLAQQLCLANY